MNRYLVFPVLVILLFGTPAIKREGLPKAIIEGMVYQVTPIVTKTGGNPELVEHGVSGLVIETGSAAVRRSVKPYCSWLEIRNKTQKWALPRKLEFSATSIP